MKPQKVNKYLKRILRVLINCIIRFIDFFNNNEAIINYTALIKHVLSTSKVRT